MDLMYLLSQSSAVSPSHMSVWENRRIPILIYFALDTTGPDT